MYERRLVWMEVFPLCSHAARFMHTCVIASLAARSGEIVAYLPFLHRRCPSLCVRSFAGIHIEMMKEITLSIAIELSVSRAIRA